MSTEIKLVNGFVGNKENIWKGRVTITVTNQHGGEIVMLQEGNARIGVDLKYIEKLAEKARKA